MDYIIKGHVTTLGVKKAGERLKERPDPAGPAAGGAALSLEAAAPHALPCHSPKLRNFA